MCRTIGEETGGSNDIALYYNFWVLISYIKVQLNLFLVFVLNYLSYNFTHFCENVFNFGLIFFVSYCFEIQESFHHFGSWLHHQETGNSRE